MTGPDTEAMGFFWRIPHMGWIIPIRICSAAYRFLNKLRGLPNYLRLIFSDSILVLGIFLFEDAGALNSAALLRTWAVSTLSP